MEFISKLFADFILLIGEQAQTFWGNLILLNFSWQQILIDITLVSIIFYLIFTFLKGSRGMHVLVGICFIGFFFFISRALQLVALGWLLDRFLTVVLVAIPIVFQKELRIGLERLGNTKIFKIQKERQIDRMIRSVAESCEEMAKNRIGALIVFQRTTPLKEFVDTGIVLDAKISAELILSIFKTKSPLHDGAVIINNERIQAASCILPHSFETTDSGLGTRHKAGIGLSESTDAIVIIVSEETGNISFSQNGKMEKNISVAELKSRLHSIHEPQNKKKTRKSRYQKK